MNIFFNAKRTYVLNSYAKKEKEKKKAFFSAHSTKMKCVYLFMSLNPSAFLMQDVEVE